jgi:hypothetical protein
VAINDFFEKLNLNGIIDKISSNVIGALFLLALIVIGVMGWRMSGMYSQKQYNAIENERKYWKENYMDCDMVNKEIENLMYHKADSIAWDLYIQKMKFLDIHSFDENTITIKTKKNND